MNLAEQFEKFSNDLKAGFAAVMLALAGKTPSGDNAAASGAGAAAAASGSASGSSETKPAGADTSASSLKDLKSLFDGLQGRFDTLNKEYSTTATKLAEAQTRITALEKDVTSKDGEITKLKGEARTVADLAASQGINVDRLPAGQAADGDPKTGVLKEYQRLLAEDSMKAGAYWQANRKAIEQAMASL